ncbi:phage baseplate assembly protein V [Anaeroselena agilis]|uniref:Phage baseplate assembly protein V n=1 Tax=Anaeroselena agilis TaxID=3063788 RepID=A0ABU3NZG3_9FIRM|nr:phage baseplate assembly protein V [Selenomonadales bacterium 4137-cl]
MDSEVKNLFRVGTVSAIDEVNQLVRVAFDDLDDTVSAWLQVAAWGAYIDDNFWLPDPDEQVMCMFMPTGRSEGYVLFSVRGAVNAPKAGAQGRRYIRFADGAVVEHDRASSTMTITTAGVVNVTAGTVNISGAAGDVVVNGISLVNHVHGGVAPGGSTTGTPV